MTDEDAQATINELKYWAWKRFGARNPGEGLAILIFNSVDYGDVDEIIEQLDYMRDGGDDGNLD